MVMKEGPTNGKGHRGWAFVIVYGVCIMLGAQEYEMIMGFIVDF